MARRADKKWRLYEQLAELYLARHPEARVTRNKVIVLPSGTKRYLDIWIEQEAPYLNWTIKTAINCKDYSRELSRQQVGAAWEQFEVLGADVNVLIAPNGYDEGAREAAARHRIECMVLTWEQATESAWEAPFFHACRALADARHERHPTVADAERVTACLQRSSLAHFFFHGLENAAWLAVLLESGYLQRALTDQSSWLSIDVSRYIHRVAAAVPEVVVAAIEVSTEPNDICGHELLAAAAELNDSDLQARAARAAAGWAALRGLGCQDLVAKLVGSLCRARRSEAVALFAAFWGPAGIGTADAETPEARVSYPRPHQLYQLTRETLPALLEIYPWQTWQALDVQLDGPWTAGGHWGAFTRAAIEPHPQNGRAKRAVDATGVLIDAARDALVASCQDDPARGQRLLRRMLHHPNALRRRLALHVLRISRPAYGSLVREALGSDALREDVDVHHEFWGLAGERLSDLREAERSRFLTSVFEGPTRIQGTPLEYREAKLRDQLQMLESQLSPSEAGVLQGLIDRYGRSPHPEFLVYGSEVMMGPTSPVTAEQMHGMDAAEVFGSLASFEPSDEFMAPSPVGAARELETEVLRRPSEFAAALDQMPDLRFPTYYEYVFRALGKAVSKDTGVDLAPQIRLAERLVERNSEPSSGALDSFDTGDWIWVKSELCRWVEAVSRADLLDRQQIDQVWSLIAAIHERTEFGECLQPNHGAVHESINAPTGKLAHAVCAFAVSLCRRKQNRDAEVAGRLPGSGFADERSFALLDTMLEQPDPPVRAAIGMWLSSLTEVAHQWVSERIPVLFPAGDDRWWSTFEGYLFGTREISEAMRTLLRPRYRRALARHAILDKGTLYDPGRALADHVVLFYLNGHEDPDDPDSLMRGLIDTGDDELLASAAWSLGARLRSGAGDNSGWNATRRWWGLRARYLEGRPTEEGHRESEAFVMWLEDLPGDEGLETIWPLLRPCVERASRGVIAHHIIEYAAREAPRRPDYAVQILDDLLRQRGIPPLATTDQIRIILEAGRDAGGEVAGQAVGLAHWLGENRGLFQLQDITTPRV